MKNAFKFPMKSSERVWGWLYIPIHVALPWLIVYVLGAIGLSFSGVYITLIHYTLSFVMILVIAMSFLRKSFSDLLDGFWRAIQSVILGYAFYFVMSLAVSLIFTHFAGEHTNPNTEEVIRLVRQNRTVMTVVAVALAPIIEETMFRGAVFGTIRQKSRVLAYIVSALLFSVYHLWYPALTGFTPALLLDSLQYIPASIALAWCYERGGTIWAPILLHAVVNFLSTRV